MLEFALRSFLTLVVIVDPLGLTPVYIGLVGHRPPGEQRRIAARSVMIAGGVMAVFALTGRPLFEYLGVSLHALKAAGGVILFKIGVDMVMAQRTRETPEEAEESLGREDISIFPLAIPLIAGPGALASLLVLAAEAEGKPVEMGILLVSAVVVLAIAYGLLRASEAASRLLGQTGINVVTRVLGVILAALAVQYVADGTRELLFGASQTAAAISTTWAAAPLPHSWR